MRQLAMAHDSGTIFRIGKNGAPIKGVRPAVRSIIALAFDENINTIPFMEKRRGYLMIEVIIGLSIFALVAGVVTQGFLVGLKLYSDVDDGDPQESVITFILTNRIKSSMGTDASMEAGFGSEKWKMEIKAKNQIANIGQKLYAFNVSVAKIVDSQGNRIDRPQAQEYHIFRYLP
jgi:hypothetical protein